jgi:hypothetical protein
MVGAQVGFVDGQGALKQSPGTFEIALRAQDASEVVEAGRDGEMIGAKVGLQDGKGALV